MPDNQDNSNQDKNQNNTDKNQKPTQDEKPEMVSKAELKKVLDQLHVHKARAKELEEKIATEEESKLKANNQWKELAEANEKKAKDAELKAAKLQESYINNGRFNAVKEKCVALGLHPNAADDLAGLDLSDITVETTNTGKVTYLGADKFAERVKTLKPHWFTEKAPPVVNTNGQRVLDSQGAVTPQMILAAEKEASKSGDKSKYNDLHKRYQQQRLAKR